MPSDATADKAPSRVHKLLIVNSALYIGGAEQVAADLAANVSTSTFETEACYLKDAGPMAEQMLESGIKLQPVPGLVPGKRDYLTFLRLRRLIRKHRIDVIHTHDLHGLIDGSLCRLIIPDLRLVHTFHFGNYPHRHIRYQFVERLLWRIPDALVAVSHLQKQSILNSYGIPESRIRVIWNGVAPPELSPQMLEISPPLPTGAPVIVSISTLIPQKGLEYLLAAADQLRRSDDKFVLLIAGDGALKSELCAHARRLGLQDHVRFLGWVPRASNRVLPIADIFVQSSIWEAMSIVVLEAMAYGKAMAVTAVGENPRVVIPGETGLMVPPESPDALAAALRVLLRSPELRKRLGQGAKARYEQKFTVKHMADAYEQLYLEVVGHRR